MLPSSNHVSRDAIAGARSSSVTGKLSRDSDVLTKPSSNLIAAGALSIASAGPTPQQRMEGFSGIIGTSAGGKKYGVSSNQPAGGKKDTSTKGLTGPLSIGGSN